MFFRKNHTPAQNTQTNTDKKPIYVLGDNDLALFLTAKLQENGQRSILLTSSASALNYTTFNLTLKEEYNLQKREIGILTTACAKEEPAAVIISCHNSSFRAHLTLLPSQRIQEIPIICFNTMVDIETIRPLLGSAFCKAYFNGYLNRNGNMLSACGFLPEIILSAEKKENEKTTIEKTMEATGLKVSVSDKDVANFWKNNASRILGYLTTSPKQHILDILNNKEAKQNLQIAANELCQLAKYEKVKLSTEDILRELFDVPRDFYYKTSNCSKIENASQLDKLYNMLSERARSYKCKIPAINQLIKQNYENLFQK